MRGKSDKKGTTGVGGSFAVHLGLRPFGLNLACSTPTGTEALERRPGATRLDLRHSEHANADQSKAEQKPFALDLIKKRRTGHRVGRAVGGGHISQAPLPVRASAGGGGKAENRPPPAHTEPLAAPLEAVPKKASAPMQLSGMCSA